MQAGLHRFAGNRKAYLGWLEKFRAEHTTLEDIMQDLRGDGRAEAMKALHAFKGRVGMLGMIGLWQAIVALEGALKENREFELLLAEAGRQQEQVLASLAQVLAPH